MSFQSLALVVDQPLSAASADKAPPAWFGPPFDPSVALGVFHPVCNKEETLTDVRCPTARSRGISNPHGVNCLFQVSANKVEPSCRDLRFAIRVIEAVRSKLAFLIASLADDEGALDLLSEDDRGLPCPDKTIPVRPEVAFVLESLLRPGNRESLTWT